MIPWLIFGFIVIVMLVLDLGVFQRRDHVIQFKEAMLRSAGWIVLALLFNLGIYFFDNHVRAVNFLTGYVVEESLSIDNIFVFVLIFHYFKIPPQYQPKILFWGIFGAVVIRGLFIVVGLVLIENFHWLIYLMGIFLIVTGLKLGWEKDKDIDPEKNFILKLFKRVLPYSMDHEGGKFFVQKNNRRHITPLFVALIVVETTDIIFAVDSIPAIFAITTDPFIVYTSNIFAILGLRSLYFALAGMMRLFSYLHYGLALILIFVGIKMLDLFHVSVGVTLSVIVLVLMISVAASLLRIKKNQTP